MSTPTEAAQPAKLIVQDNSSISFLMDTSRFEHCYRIARLMASASLIPDHLKIDGKSKQPLPPETIAANCFMIVNQAFRWEFDPFGVAPETYVVGGKLAFQGKLVAAAINARAGLEERLNYTFEGKPGTDDFTVTVSGRLKGEKEPRTVRVSVGQAKTDNQMWKKDPEQKLIYTGAIKWARRHCPEIILGVLIEDEVEEIAMRNVTPPPSGNPYNDPRFAQDKPEVLPDPAPAKKPATRSKAKQEAASEPQDAQTDEPPAEEAQDVPAMPSRKEMYQAIKDSIRDAEVSPATAQARFKKAGFMPADKEIQETTDEELFVIYQARETVLPPVVQS